MRKSILLAAGVAAILGLSACSEKTQDSAEQTANAAGDDIEAAGAAAGNAVEDGANAVGNAAEDAASEVGKAADKAAAETDELGDKTKNAAARVEADAHNESVTEAKND